MCYYFGKSKLVSEAREQFFEKETNSQTPKERAVIEVPEETESYAGEGSETKKILSS